MDDYRSVPLSIPFLELVRALQSARDMYVHETRMAGHLGLQEPRFHLSRCERLFALTYGDIRRALGIAGDHRICAALLALEIPPALEDLGTAELQRYRFEFASGRIVQAATTPAGSAAAGGILA